MGKYFCVVDGKVHDWKFVRSKTSYDSPTWEFYLGETHIGNMVKARRSGWDPYVYHTRCPFGGLYGFATRYDAAQYMLKVCGFIKHPDQLYEASMKNLGFVPVKFETYLDLIKAKEKLDAIEANVEGLESNLSWVDNPERMGQ
jgi:hypothetical protein